jgi:hypothetical protein
MFAACAASYRPEGRTELPAAVKFVAVSTARVPCRHEIYSANAIPTYTRKKKCYAIPSIVHASVNLLNMFFEKDQQKLKIIYTPIDHYNLSLI